MDKEKANLICPKCGHKQEGEIPTNTCIAFYSCQGCKEMIAPAGKDCCVFCSYADKPCPTSHKNN